MSGSKVRLTPVRSRGERQRGRKERERAKEEKEFMLGTARKCGRIFLNILCAETQKELFAPSTNSPIFCKQRPYPLPRVSIYTCNALCIYCSQGYSCYCYLLLSCCQADGKPCTMLPTSCALFQLLKGTGPDGACVPVFCACVCVSPGLHFGSRLSQNWHKPKWVIHAKILSLSPPHRERICVGLYMGNAGVCVCLCVLLVRIHYGL